MQVKTRALADQACHHPLRQAHGRQAEQGRSCRVGHRGECEVVVDGDSEQPQERLPNEVPTLLPRYPSACELSKCEVLGGRSVARHFESGAS